MKLLFFLIALPGLLLAQGSDNTTTWTVGTVTATTVPPADFKSREALQPPGIVPRAGLASPTRVPWINANGWRFRRNHAAKFAYDVPAGKGALAAAEAFAYGADAVVKIDPADAADVGKMMAFLKSLPTVDLPDVADLQVVDDGSAIVGEVMNLLTRRNLLFSIVKGQASDAPKTVRVGSTDYPVEQAADPSAFAQKVRHDLTDEKRSLRMFGSEVVIARLTSDGKRARLHLLNYTGRELEGLRISLLGSYKEDQTYIAGPGQAKLLEFALAGGRTEFSLPRIGAYTVIDLAAQ